MSRHLSRRPTRPRATRLLPAGLAVLALSLTGCGSDDTAGDDRPTAGDAAAGEAPAESSAAAPTDAPTAALTVPDGPAGRCMVPSAETLAGMTTAFEGTVVGLEAGTATLQVDRWFSGPESGQEPEQVTVSAPKEDLQALLGAVDFEVGGTYLVSATGERLSLCGFTAEKSPELEAIYTEAFAS